MNSIMEYRVKKEETGEKLIFIVCSKMNISSRLLRKLKKSKNIFLNNRAVSVNASVRENDMVKIIMELEKNTFDPEPLDIEVVYEDKDIILVNKRPFMVVHPTKGHPYGTLGNGLAYYNLERGLDYKIRFINRLDRDTSGLVMIAKNPNGQKIISDQMMSNQVDKYYFAVVEGVIIPEKGTVNAPVGLANEDDVARVVIASGQEAITHYEVVEKFGVACLVKIKLETGRTHQIRVHMKHIGHPLIGDTLYGKSSNLINRQALHAAQLGFFNVRTGEPCTVDAVLPEDMKALIKALQKDDNR